MELIRQEITKADLPLENEAQAEEQPQQFKPLYIDELSGVERMLLKGITQKIMEHREGGLPIKDIRLKPECYKVYEGIQKKCEDRVEAKVGNLFFGVKIRKGTLLQKDIIEVGGSWAITEDDRQKQREELKKEQAN